jgi:hypothetical protein
MPEQVTEYDMKANSQTTKLLASFLATALLAFPVIAPAALETLEEVVELELDSVLLPGHEADRMKIRRCEECEELVVQVTRDTVYRLGGPRGEVVTLSEFMKAARNSTDPAELILLVAYVPDTGRVTRMIISGSIG